MALTFLSLDKKVIGDEGRKPTLEVELGILVDDEKRLLIYTGNQALQGVYAAIANAVGIHPELRDWQRHTGTENGNRKVGVILGLNGYQSSGEAEAPSDFEAGIRAYLDALSKLPKYEQLSLF